MLKELYFGLLLALEFESPNKILKNGIFLWEAVDKLISATPTFISENFINNLLIFVMGFAVGIAINQFFPIFCDW